MSLSWAVSSPDSGGRAYAPGDTGTIDQPGGAGATYTVLTVDETGRVVTIATAGGGTGYTDSNAEPTAVTSGSGDGSLQVDILAAAGAITSIQVEQNFAGWGFAVGDTGFIQGGDSGATYVIDAVNPFGSVISLTAAGGTGYVTSSSNVAVPTTGSGTSIGLNITAPAGVVLSASVATIAGGSGYAPGDTGIIVQGFFADATYSVLTVNEFGTVLTLSAVIPAHYVALNGNFTGPTSGSGNEFMFVDLFEAAAATSGIVEGTFAGFWNAGRAGGGIK